MMILSVFMAVFPAVAGSGLQEARKGERPQEAAGADSVFSCRSQVTSVPHAKEPLQPSNRASHCTPQNPAETDDPTMR